MQTGEYSNTLALTNKQLIEQTKARNKAQEKQLDSIIDTVQALKLEVENQKTIGKTQLKLTKKLIENVEANEISMKKLDGKFDKFVTYGKDKACCCYIFV